MILSEPFFSSSLEHAKRIITEQKNEFNEILRQLNDAEESLNKTIELIPKTKCIFCGGDSIYIKEYASIYIPDYWSGGRSLFDQYMDMGAFANDPDCWECQNCLTLKIVKYTPYNNDIESTRKNHNKRSFSAKLMQHFSFIDKVIFQTISHIFFYYVFVGNDCYKMRLTKKELITRFGMKEVSRTKSKPEKGYVYFVNGNGVTKIGKAKSIRKRTNWLDVVLPFNVNLIHYIESDDYDKCEKHFHKIFHSKKVNGEWFDLNDNDIREVKKINVLNFK